MPIYCTHCPAMFDFTESGLSESEIWDMLTEHNLDCHEIPYAETKRGRTRYFTAIFKEGIQP